MPMENRNLLGAEVKRMGTRASGEGVREPGGNGSTEGLKVPLGEPEVEYVTRCERLDREALCRTVGSTVARADWPSPHCGHNYGDRMELCKTGRGRPFGGAVILGETSH